MNNLTKKLSIFYLIIECFGVNSQTSSEPAPFFNRLLKVDRGALPTKHEVDNVQFFLFTPSQHYEKFYLQPNLSSLQNSTFNPMLGTIILLSGYISGHSVDSVLINFKNKILREGSYNVIIPDITQYMVGSYPQAVANVKPIGVFIAQLINFLIDNTYVRAENFTLVGWSLGAHISGIAGKNIKNLGKIIALDPAGPDFDNAPPEDRLTRFDALFVQAIHTNGGKDLLHGFGTVLSVGHLDFYVNGGSEQPACEASSIYEYFLLPYKVFQLICDHIFSVVVFYESIDNSKCKFEGVSCNDYESFLSGNCTYRNSIVAEAGFHGKKIENVVPGTKFYFKTKTALPFCINNPDYLKNASTKPTHYNPFRSGKRD